MASVAPSSKVASKKPGYCDICWGRDGFRKLHLQQCIDCNVRFHSECYGLRQQPKSDSTIKCWACRAVGKTVRGVDPSNNNKHYVLTQSKRPTECCLCSIDDGSEIYHAMHPLHTELTNEHIVLPDNSHIGAGKEARLAWVHSLCAYSLNCSRQTGGCVFACASDGTYDEGEQGGDTSDEEANTVDEDGTSQQKIADVHHFGFAMNNQNNDEENLYARTIKNFQTLRCTICGANDQPAGVYRIPVQCSANDPGEFEEFQGCHLALRRVPCMVPMHVGCAIWGRNDAGEHPVERRVYYFPGTNSKNDKGEYESPNTVANIYCKLHARDLVLAKKAGSSVLRYNDRPSVTHVAPPEKERKSSAAAVSVSDSKVNASVSARADKTKKSNAHLAPEEKPKKKKIKSAIASESKEPAKKQEVKKPAPKPKKMDWSSLVVGPNYDPNGMDFTSWDTYDDHHAVAPDE